MAGESSTFGLRIPFVPPRTCPCWSPRRRWRADLRLATASLRHSAIGSEDEPQVQARRDLGIRHSRSTCCSAPAAFCRVGRRVMKPKSPTEMPRADPAGAWGAIASTSLGFEESYSGQSGSHGLDAHASQLRQLRRLTGRPHLPSLVPRPMPPQERRRNPRVKMESLPGASAGYHFLPAAGLPGEAGKPPVRPLRPCRRPPPVAPSGTAARD